MRLQLSSAPACALFALHLLVSEAWAQTKPSIVNLDPPLPPHATWPLFVNTAAQKGAPGTNFADPGSARGMCWVDVVGRNPAEPNNPAKVGPPDGIPDLVVANSNSPALPLGAQGASVLIPGITTVTVPCRVKRGEADGTFTEVASQMSQLQPTGFGVDYPGGSPWAVSAADYDEDGDTDLFYGCGGFSLASPNALLRNEGTGQFRNVSLAAGLTESQATFSAAWLDYDLDGDLDLFVLNGGSIFGEFTGPDPDPTARLHRNNGNGTLTEVGAAAGVNLKASGFTCTTTDLDRDGWPDLVASCFMQYNKVFYNNQDGTFSFMAPKTNLKVALSLDDLTPAAEPGTKDFPYLTPYFEERFPLLGLRSMPVSAQDFNGDGWMDLLFTSWSSQQAGNPFGALGDVFSPAERAFLYINRGDQDGDGHGDGEFRECAAEVGLIQVGGNMGTSLADFNRDGSMDIYVGAGGPNLQTQLEEDYLWVHEASMWPVDFQSNPDQPLAKAFWEVGALAGTYANTYMTHGVLSRPIPDGRIDVIAGTGGPSEYEAGQPDVYFESSALADGSTPHSMLVNLKPTRSNVAASGARVELIRDTAGGPLQTLVRERTLASDFSCCNLGPLHFGLGQGGALFANVRWPSGVRSGQLLWGSPATESLTLVEPEFSLALDASYPKTGGMELTLFAKQFGSSPSAGLLVYGVLVPDGLGGQSLLDAGVLISNFQVAPGQDYTLVASASDLPLGLYAVLLIEPTTGAILAASSVWHDPAFVLAAGPQPLLADAAAERPRWTGALRASPAQPSSPRLQLSASQEVALHAESLLIVPDGNPGAAERIELSGSGMRRFPGGEQLAWRAGQVEVRIDGSALALVLFPESGPRVLLAGGTGCCDTLPQERKIALEFSGTQGPLEVDGELYIGQGQRISD